MMSRLYVLILLVFSVDSFSQVTFKSVAFENGVRKHLRIDNSVVINQSDLDTITNINLSGLSIMDINDVSLIGNVQQIDLSHNAIQNIQPLLYLPYVDVIDLSHNNLDLITPLIYSNKRNIKISVHGNNIEKFNTINLSSFSNIELVGYNRQNDLFSSFLINNMITSTDENGQAIIHYDVWDSEDLCDDFVLNYGDGSSDNDLLCGYLTNQKNHTYESPGFKELTLNRADSTLTTHFVAPYEYIPTNLNENNIELNLPPEIELQDVIFDETKGNASIVDNELRYQTTDIGLDTLKVSYFYGDSRYRESFFVFVDNTPVLPVKLVEFTAEPNQLDAELYWLTASEINSDYFGIERSYNGVSFEEITRVQAQGNSSSDTEYNYVDVGVGNHRDKAYYRLRQVDLDDSFEYSDIREVEFEKGNLKLSPNPATNDIVISWDKEIQSIRIVSTDGTIVKNVETNATFNVSLIIADLPSGSYIVVVNDNKTLNLIVAK